MYYFFCCAKMLRGAIFGLCWLGGLGGNVGVVAPAEKVDLRHSAAHGEHDVAQPPHIHRGHFLHVQQHCVRDHTSNNQPGVCVRVRLWFQLCNQDRAMIAVTQTLSTGADTADADTAGGDGHDGRHVHAGVRSAAE